MSVLNRLTIKNLRLNKKRTIVTIIGIILSTALMVGIGLLFSSFQDLMIRDTIGYSGKYEAKYNDVDLIKLNDIKNKNFTYFYEKPIGFSKIESSNEYKPYMYITSVNKEYFDELKLIEGSFPKNENEVVISNHVITNGGLNYKVGDIVTFTYGSRNIDGNITLANSELVDGEFLTNEGTHTYKIVGIVERSNFENYSACGYTAFTLDVNNDKGSVNLYVMFNKNKKIIIEDGQSYLIERGSFGINCHRASEHKLIAKIGLYSAGCCVLQDSAKFIKMISIVESKLHELNLSTVDAYYITETQLNSL